VIRGKRAKREIAKLLKRPGDLFERAVTRDRGHFSPGHIASRTKVSEKLKHAMNQAPFFRA